MVVYDCEWKEEFEWWDKRLSSVAGTTLPGFHADFKCKLRGTTCKFRRAGETAPRLSRLIRRRRGTSRDFVQRRVDVEASFPRNADHLIGSRRRAAHSQDTIALVDEPDRDRVENLIEGIVADSLRSGRMNERESVPAQCPTPRPEAAVEPRTLCSTLQTQTGVALPALSRRGSLTHNFERISSTTQTNPHRSQPAASSKQLYRQCAGCSPARKPISLMRRRTADTTLRTSSHKG